MDQTELAARLTDVSREERAALLSEHVNSPGLELARAIKAIFDAHESSDPARAIAAAAALTDLAQHSSDPHIDALAAWTSGMAAQLEGRIEDSLGLLRSAEDRYESLGQPRAAADVRISTLIALAILGRYDEAIATGLAARDVFLTHHDLLATGKIEQNIGNIHFLREQYPQAEAFYRAARERYLALEDQKQLAQIENVLGNVLVQRHQFQAAAELYQQALLRADLAGLEITAAEVECNIGFLSLSQGRFDQALDYLERSRRKYAVLDMPHEIATLEQEIADAYLELNLAPEAAAIYARVVPTFAALGMHAEQARAVAYSGRAQLALGRIDAARTLLAEARQLYDAQGNATGAAMITLTEAQIAYAESDYATAAALAAQAAAPFKDVGALGRLLMARWLRGEAARAAGDMDLARELLTATLGDADAHAAPQIAQRCHTSLGLLAAAEDDSQRAEGSFRQAITLIEELRAPLPADEFRAAFVADKLTPYAEMVRLCLADRQTDRRAEALSYVERARSRSLLDMLGGVLTPHAKPRDAFEEQLFARLTQLRQELNWFYNQINRAQDDPSRSATIVAELHTTVREREDEILSIRRQIQQHGGDGIAYVEPIDLAQLQHALGPDTALVEYYSLDGALLAFVVTHERIDVVRGLMREDKVEAALTQFRFQIDALRYGADRVRTHIDQLTERAQHYLRMLYDGVFQPIAERLSARRVVIVPHRTLHYLPFHALFDGATYLIERRDVCYAPSAAILAHCLAMPRRPLQHALLLGVPDTQTPRVRDEILALAPLFPRATTLLEDQATLGALQTRSSAADVLHLACHGYFRADNPLFSSLRLADGWLTVRDAYDLDLHCGLVALSACETGISAVAPGDELTGLARGFLGAGAPSLVVSLWNVDDATTATLMTHFYTYLQAGDSPGAALAHAQRDLLAQHPHPFFWSPFILIGRW